MIYKRALLTVVLVLFSLSSYTQVSLDKYDSSFFYNEGKEKFRKADYIGSAESYNLIHELDVDYNEGQYERILSLLYGDRKEEALAVCQTLFEEKRYLEYPPFLLLHSILLSDLGNYDEALEKLDIAEGFLKNSASLNYNRAIVYLRLEDKQKAVDILKENIIKDPSHLASYYNLGVLALEDGQIVEGSLLLMTYLLFNYEGGEALNALKALNVDYSKYYTVKPELKINEGGDDFHFLEEILRNKFPYNKNYPILIDYDYYVTRNIQAITEYFEEHETSDGFFENKFGTLYKYISENKLTKFYLYSSLSAVKNNLEKEYSKNQKDISDFQSVSIKKTIWSDIYNKAYIDGKVYHVDVNADGSKYFYQMKDSKMDGMYFQITNLGMPLVKGYLKEGELDGVKTSYRKDGSIESEQNYIGGKRQGLFTEYYPNTQIRFVGNYENDLLTGAYKLNYLAGNNSCIGNYKMGEYDGEVRCYYPDGSLKLIANYKNGKYHGAYKKFNEVGEVAEEANYVDDGLEGSYIIYYGGGKVKSINIIKNKSIQSFYSYYINGSMEEEQIYAGGKLQMIKQFYSNGHLKGEKLYDDKEEAVSYKYYNAEGKLYFEDIFNRGKAKQSIQYRLDGGMEKLKVNGFIQFKDLEGNLISEGNLKNGELDGLWNYYYLNGVLRWKTTYSDNKVVGMREAYLKNGFRDYSSLMEDDAMNGAYNDYLNDKLSFRMYYSGNVLYGPFAYYYSNGVIQTQSFYINDELHGLKKYYKQDGTLYKTSKHIEGQLQEVKYYSDGEIRTVDFVKSNGIVDFKRSEVEKQKISIKGGVIHGVYESSNMANEMHFKENYVNDKLHGKNIYYNQSGRVEKEENYYLGTLNGESVYYDLMGNLSSRSIYEFGYLQGDKILYFPNGKKKRTIPYLNGDMEGMEYYCNSEGEKILGFHYLNNDVVGYSVLNENGELGEEVPFTNKVSKIISVYPNGKTAIEIACVNTVFHGDLVVFTKNGQMDYSEHFDEGSFDGSMVYYFNDKKYKTMDFSKGIQTGTTRYFDGREEVALSVDYENDEIHGYYKEYENNKVVKSKRYDSGILVEIL